MSEVNHPHDHFFRELLGDPVIAQSFFEHYLPAEIVRELDLSLAPEPERDVFVDDDLKEHFADLLYRVRLAAGGEAYVFILLEHKSAPDKWVALQTLRYQVQLWTRLREQGVAELPPIYTVVVYHGAARWNVPRNFQALTGLPADSRFGKFVPEFEYHLIDLATLDDTQLRGLVYLQAGLWALRSSVTEQAKEQLVKTLQLLLPENEPVRRQHVVTILKYYSYARREFTPHDLAGAYHTAFKEDGMTAWEELQQMGLDRGILIGKQEGKQEGRQEEALTLNLRQLRKRFGALDEITLAQIGRLTLDQLGDLSESSLDFKTKDDLDNWLSQKLPQN
jgi:predicted transposase/invertase (TIGR01784 family)